MGGSLWLAWHGMRVVAFSSEAVLFPMWGVCGWVGAFGANFPATGTEWLVPQCPSWPAVAAHAPHLTSPAAFPTCSCPTAELLLKYLEELPLQDVAAALQDARFDPMPKASNSDRLLSRLGYLLKQLKQRKLKQDTRQACVTAVGAGQMLLVVRELPSGQQQLPPLAYAHIQCAPHIQCAWPEKLVPSTPQH